MEQTLLTVVDLEARLAEQGALPTSKAAEAEDQSAKLKSKQARLSDLEATIANLEARLAEQGAVPTSMAPEDQSAKPRSKQALVGELETRMVSQENEFAASKRSLTWHMIEPLRTLWRGLVRSGSHRDTLKSPRARLRLRLVAIHRHPFNAEKRKAFRRNRQANADARARSPRADLRLRLTAAWRHPTRPEKRKAYRKGRLERPTQIGSPFSRHSLATLVAAAWRHPFNAKKRKTFRWLRRELPSLPIAAPLRPVPTIEEAGFPPPAGKDLLHARLFERYVRNSVGDHSVDEYVACADTPPPAARRAAKLITYYLPQFHPIPENNRWWGEGFTEWRNVVRAFPVFEGHYQPRLPGELGYYDLRVPEVMRRQVELARLHGIWAFCFYFYWFGGQRLLEAPIDAFLQNKNLDLHFSLCWANENWSRRWDGGNNEVLIAQRHSPEDDIAFIRYVAKYFADSRYVKVDGKPVLTVYQPEIIPHVREMLLRWREEARRLGYSDLYLIATNAFGFNRHVEYGFDALAEFPPHSVWGRELSGDLDLSLLWNGGRVYSYPNLVERELQKPPEKRVHPGAMPSWDNSARRPFNAHIYHGATPAIFRTWLAHCFERARTNPISERFIFINAWNEWAEGAYLEPDRRYGYAYLQAVREAVRDEAEKCATRRIVVVSHDAFFSGAQLLAFNIVRSLATEFGFSVAVVLLGPGALKGDFERFATVYDLSGEDPQGPEARQLAASLFASGYDLAIANTTVSGHFVGTLRSAGLRCVALVHEMRQVIVDNGLETQADVIVRNASVLVFGAQEVRGSFASITPLGGHPDVKIRPQGLYKGRNRLASDVGAARIQLRAMLGIADDARIILGVGHAQHRKGIDLFVEAGLAICRKRTDVHFLWVGGWVPAVRREADKRLEDEADAAHFHFIGEQAETDVYFAGADVYALTSREDPLPSVVFEAMDARLPVVCFDGSGGIPAIVADVGGVVIPAGDVAAFAGATMKLLDDASLRAKLGAVGRAFVERHLAWKEYLFDLLDFADAGFTRVSVIVPNYNYARYLRDRLASIFRQTYPIFEIIVLDDASTDGSLRVIEDTSRAFGRAVEIVTNDTNTGSSLVQWRRGVERARGEYVWIAEADDTSDPDFLARIVTQAVSAGAGLAFTDSFQIDQDGRRLGDSYAPYCDGGREGRFHGDFTLPGRAFLKECLSVKNTILNVSAVLWRRSDLMRALVAAEDAPAKHRVAGDWRLYAELALGDPPIVYLAAPLNGHRRHVMSVTQALDVQRHLAEIVEVHRFIAEQIRPDDALGRRMHAYEEEIAAQFRLAGAGAVPDAGPANERADAPAT